MKRASVRPPRVGRPPSSSRSTAAPDSSVRSLSADRAPTSLGNRRVSLARALSKLGVCSRAQAVSLVEGGEVRINGRLARDPAVRVDPGSDRLEVHGREVRAERKVYLMMNKPRGSVTSRSEPGGAPTVYEHLNDPALPWVAPVGRLDRASEGLLLFTNDSRWAARIADPATHLDKVYHVQIDRLPGAELFRQMREGVDVGGGERLSAKRVVELRRGGRNSWLEVVLDEGRNRHIRRLLAALGVQVLRLVRISIGSLELGTLPKGQVRALTPTERERLSHESSPTSKRGESSSEADRARLQGKRPRE